MHKSPLWPRKKADDIRWGGVGSREPGFSATSCGKLQRNLCPHSFLKSHYLNYLLKKGHDVQSMGPKTSAAAALLPPSAHQGLPAADPTPSAPGLDSYLASVSGLQYN